MTGDCEFILRIRPKSGREHDEGPQAVEVHCTLTGRPCFCESFPLTCTRRTWALAYVAKQGARATTAPRTG